MRKIKIFTTTGIPGVIKTDVTTFEGLKPLLLEQNINLESTKVLVGETKLELSENEAILPDGDFKLFIVPVKTKSGWKDEEEEDTFIQDTLGEIRPFLAYLQHVLSYICNSCLVNIISYVGVSVPPMVYSFLRTPYYSM